MEASVRAILSGVDCEERPEEGVHLRIIDASP